MVDAVLATLPPGQRLVITLRDVQGLSADETCELLGVSEANQRVLLHRARGKVRSALMPIWFRPPFSASFSLVVSWAPRRSASVPAGAFQTPRDESMRA